MTREVGPQGVGGIPPDLAARVGRKHADDLLHQGHGDENSGGNHQVT